jgi:hypothetical protein
MSRSSKVIFFVKLRGLAVFLVVNSSIVENSLYDLLYIRKNSLTFVANLKKERCAQLSGRIK